MADTDSARLVISLAEIAAMRVQCECGTAISFPVGRRIQLPESCPGCQEFFDADRPRLRPIVEFIEALTMATLAAEDVKSLPEVRRDRGRVLSLSLEVVRTTK